MAKDGNSSIEKAKKFDPANSPPTALTSDLSKVSELIQN